MTILPLALQAARLRLVNRMPYLAHALWALRPVEKPGFGSMAVDMYWRLYYDPAVVEQWENEQIAGVLYHEIQHLLRAHHARMNVKDPEIANIAADAEINDDLLGEGVALPGTPITPASIGQPEGLLAEEYYAALEKGRGQASGREGGQDGERRPSESNSPARGSSDGSNLGGSPYDNLGDTSDQSESVASPGGGGDSSGRTEADLSQATVGPGKGDASGPSNNSTGRNTSTSAAQDEGTAGLPSGQTHGFDQTPKPAAGNCGSCATGIPASWEDPAPGEGGEGIGESEAQLIRRQVAKAIREHVKARGTVPGALERWAKEALQPRVDWRKVLAMYIRQAVSRRSGAVDYAYDRPSRRYQGTGVIMPRMCQPVVEPVVIVDTSGSVSDDMLRDALGEIRGILQSCGQRELTVMSVDAEVQSVQRVRNINDIKLKGGGGTDLTVGIHAAMKLRPRPQVVIVITDGYTIWPATKPQADVIVALTDESQSVPVWARKVVIR